MAKPREINASVNQWRLGLHEQGLDHVIPSLVDHPKRVTKEYLRILRLPALASVIVNAAEFIDNPAPSFAEIGDVSDRYFVALEDRLTLGRTRKLDLSDIEAYTYVRDELAGRGYKSFDIFLQEFHPTHYVGAIIANPAGEVLASMDPIEQVVTGKQLRAQKLVGDASFGYNFDDPVLRSLIYRAIGHIPKDDAEYLPGTYEFILDSPAADGLLRPVFLDYFPSY